MFRPLLIRSAPIFAALALGAVAAPSLAQGGTYFTAELAAPASEAQFAAGGVVWQCAGTQCRAPQSTARALRICTALRRETGALVTFTANGESFAAEDLARCNG